MELERKPSDELVHPTSLPSSPCPARGGRGGRIAIPGPPSFFSLSLVMLPERRRVKSETRGIIGC